MIENGLCSHKLFYFLLLEMELKSCTRNYTDFINYEYVFSKIYGYEHMDHIFNACLNFKSY